MNIVFDVDGTLTPSRGQMDTGFRAEFLSWLAHTDHAVWLCTGSDYPKTVEQVGSQVCERVAGVYGCAGNELHTGGVLQESNPWEPPQELRDFLSLHLEQQPWLVKTGQHLEVRTGLTNWSPVGRAADHEQRREFYQWDTGKGYRRELAAKIQQAFPDIDARVAGETGIDIYPRGRDKSQLADRLRPFDFFGDRCEPGGNDETIARRAARVWEVESWLDTRQVLIDHYGLELLVR